MKNETKVLALDLDDTLLRSDKSIGVATLAALDRWLAAGHEIVVATGRPPRGVASVLPPSLLHAPRIVYNGAQAIDNNEIVFARPIPVQDVRHILDWAEMSGHVWYIGLEINDTLYVNRHFEKPGVFEVADLKLLCEEPVYKIIFFFPTGRRDIEPLLAALPPTTRALVTPKFNLVQLCAHDVNKFTALRQLLAKRSVAPASVIAVGDDINDVELVRCSDIGIAVANALPEVKAVADWIAPSADDDGVAYVIDRLLNGC
ncbi:MAG: HAD family hydrolase [Caldilinea sp.]|nr:HAD family hydrolase [Caldilinea sp.]MDW8439795.1 HAD family hydrolase [Caldilineaceae bacterium]